MDSRSRGAHEKQLETGELLTAQIDTIALLGHTIYELSLRKREAIKPNLNLNKEYGAGRSGTDPCLFEARVSTRPSGNHTNGGRRRNPTKNNFS